MTEKSLRALGTIGLGPQDRESVKLDKVRGLFRYHRQNVGVKHRIVSTPSLQQLGAEVTKLPTGIVHVAPAPGADLFGALPAPGAKGDEAGKSCAFH